MHARTLALLTSLLAAAARADVPPSEVKPAEPPRDEAPAEPREPAPHVHEARPIADAPDWQLGAGVNLGTTTTGTVADPGGAGDVVLVPSATIAVERRLGLATWLGLGATVSYAHQTGDGGALLGGTGSSNGSKTTTDTSVYGATAGLRQILNLHDTVELSLLADAFIGYGYAVSDTSFTGGCCGNNSVQDTKLKTLTAGLGLGVAAEKELTRQLALRLSLHVLGLQYTHATQDSSNSNDSTQVTSTSASSFSVGLSPSASLTLRFLF